MICLLPLLCPTLLQLVCVFSPRVSPSKCLLWLNPPPSYPPISISTIQALQLTNLLFIAAQRPLCSSLCHACCPLSRSCSGSLHSSPALTFSPRPSSPPPDCNNVSKCGSACCWMETLFYTTCHLSNPRLGAGGAEAQGSELTRLWWEGGRAPRWAPKQPFSGSISHTGDGKHIHLVCLQHRGWVFDGCLMEAFIFFSLFYVFFF